MVCDYVLLIKDSNLQFLVINFWLLLNNLKVIQKNFYKSCKNPWLKNKYPIMIHRAELQVERSRRRNSRKGSHAVKSIHLIKIHKNAKITSKKSDRIEKRKKSRGAWKIITIRKDLLCITTCVCTSIYLFFVRALALLLLTAMSIIVLGDFFLLLFSR